jgi:hypothetical protein
MESWRQNDTPLIVSKKTYKRSLEKYPPKQDFQLSPPPSGGTNLRSFSVPLLTRFRSISVPLLANALR